MNYDEIEISLYKVKSLLEIAKQNIMDGKKPLLDTQYNVLKKYSGELIIDGKEANLYYTAIHLHHSILKQDYTLTFEIFENILDNLLPPKINLNSWN